MADLPWMVVFFCFAGPPPSAASPVLRSPLVIPVGQNASLPCNLTSSREITWYRLRSDELEPLLTVTQSGLNVTTADRHTQEGDLSHQGDVLSAVSLEIRGVNGTDAGLYFCAGRCQGVLCFGRGVQLTVSSGEGEESDRRHPPCWSLVICLVPASFLLCLLCILGFCLHSGKRRVCCCRCVSRDGGLQVGQEVGLQYASLKYADKPRPSAQGETGLVKEDVTYSTVASCNNPEA